MSYDKNKLRIGYKGRFVIHDHVAQSHHWDLRLEFPVLSLKDSLTNYYKKRVWDSTTEPEPEFLDKPGTVLRSWAIPKHKLPTSKHLLATETEDHSIDYIDFKGVIPEGYGAGTVSIYDKGSFEVVDLDYDRKYVIKFNGSKINFIPSSNIDGSFFILLFMKFKKKFLIKFQGELGNVLVELALVLPVLILLLAGIVQFGFILNAKVAVNSASYEAVRIATLAENPEEAALAAVLNYASASLPGWSFDERLKARLNIPDKNPGTLISVEVIYSIPIFFSNIFPFSAIGSNNSLSFMEVKGFSAMQIEEKE